MIGSSENRISYNGNGIATEFAYTFKILEKSDIKVLHVAIDGTEELLTKDYYVDMEKSVVLYPGYAPGAEIPEQNRPPILPVGERLVLYREVPITQESALDKHWPFNVIEAGLDKLTIICQQLFDRLQRSFYVSESTSTNFDTKVPIEAGKTFRVKDDGTGFEVTEDPGKVIDGAKALLKLTTEQAEFAKEQADASSQSAVSAQNAATLAQAWAEDSTELPSGKHSAKEWADIAEQGIMPNGVVTENKLGSDVKQRFANIENSIKDYCGIDTFEGSTDTEKLQKAIDTSQGVVLTRDITIDNIQFTKHNFYIFGAGHTVHINGTISSTILYGRGYYFDGCVFDGTGGGQFSFDSNFLVTRFTNCCFYNFANDICTGSNMQSIYFTNCYFNDNHSWAVNATRLDAVIFASCNVENGNTNFMKCNIGYNVVVRDTIIEGLSGIAFDLKGISDCIFEGLYLEGNHENFVIQQDACGNVKFDSVHCNFLDEDNKALVRLTEGGTAGMYGVFTFLNCSTDNQGYFVRVNSDGWFSKRLSFINNRGVTKNIIWDNTIRNGNISSSSLMYDSREISGVFANNGSNLMLNTIETECYGHKIVGCVVMKVLNESGSNIVKDTTLYKAIVYNDEVLILFGDGTNTYRYTVTFLYC